MRLKAPDGIGNPVIEGVEVKPGKDGIYVVAEDVGAVMLSHGYVDIDAPAKPGAPPSADAPTGGVLRGAVLVALQAMGVAVLPGAPDDLLARALRQAAVVQNDAMTAVVQRAETAEARVAELEAAQRPADGDRAGKAPASDEPPAPATAQPPEKA